MSKTTTELVKQYIIETTKRPISLYAYETLSYLMREDREMASHLCDVFDKLVRNGSTFVLQESDEQDGSEDV